MALPAGSAAASVWETPAPGEAREGVEPRSGPDMRAGPLAEMLLTAVFESAYSSYYLQCTRLRPTAGDCSSHSMWQTSPSLRRLLDKSLYALPFPQPAEAPHSRCPPKLLAAGGLFQACLPVPIRAEPCSHPACPAALKGCRAPHFEQVLEEERDWRVMWGQDIFLCFSLMLFPGRDCS